MLPFTDVPPARVTLAHPLTQPFDLPLSPLVTAVLAAVFVSAVAISWRSRGNARLDSPEAADAVRPGKLTSWAGELTPTQVVTRTASVVLLGLAIAAGRFGADDELDNLAPALTLGAAWPLLVLVSSLLGPVWRWLDPWDGVARALVRGPTQDVPGHVWPAVGVSLAWVWYLSVYPEPLDPRAVGAALALYTVATVAGCLALGRERWLGSGEPLGLLLSWMARLPRRSLLGWEAPRGAEALLGVVLGGILFGAVRRSELWGALNAVRGATPIATLGLVSGCAGVAALLMAITRWSRHGSAIARAMVPAVAGVIVAVAMDRNRLTTSVQLLPALIGDPFGVGWDVLGPAGAGLEAAPLGVTGLAVGQLAVLVVGHTTGALVLARSTRPSDRGPATVALAAVMAASVIAILTH